MLDYDEQRMTVKRGIINIVAKIGSMGVSFTLGTNQGSYTPPPPSPPALFNNFLGKCVTFVRSLANRCFLQGYVFEDDIDSWYALNPGFKTVGEW